MSPEPSWLLRVIESFSNETDFLVGETILPPVELSEIQALWGQPIDEPMVDEFEIGPEHLPFLSTLTDMPFDFSTHSYFLSARTTDWEATKAAGGYLGLYPRPTELKAFPDIVPVMPRSAT